MGTFASAAGGRASEQKGVAAVAEREQIVFAMCDAVTATGSKRRRRFGDFPARCFSDNLIFFMEKYSSGRRGVTRNLVGRESVAWVQIPPSPPEKSTHLSTKTMCAFFNEIRLWRVKYGSAM